LTTRFILSIAYLKPWKFSFLRIVKKVVTSYFQVSGVYINIRYVHHDKMLWELPSPCTQPNTQTLHHVTRVNSTNVLNGGLRIEEVGRRMNSKVKSVKQGVYQK
jgi:hypothetical protein